MATNYSLTIDTYFGKQTDFPDDEAPLMLAAVQGSEGISVPYVYDCTLYRSKTLPDIDPKKLINTPVTFGIRLSDKKRWDYRHGMVSAFSRAGVTDQEWTVLQNEYYIYTLRLVPAFKMLDFEVAYRAFADMTLKEIIKELTDDFPGIFAMTLGNYFNFNQLTEKDLPKLDYCVQYGESTFNFISRMLAQSGISYYFNHHFGEAGAVRETMRLVKSSAQLKGCREYAGMHVHPFAVGPDKINSFSLSANPVQRFARVGDFNEDDPFKPAPKPEITNSAILQEYDLLKDVAPEASQSRFSTEQFPANGDADVVMRGIEANTMAYQGQTRNRSFAAGFTFDISEDPTHEAKIGSVLAVVALSFVATENSIGHTALRDAVSFFLNFIGQNTVMPLLSDIRDGKPKGSPDMLSSLASQGLSNYLGNEFSYDLGADIGNHGGASRPSFFNFVGGGALAVLGGAVSSLATQIKGEIDKHWDTYANAFVAVPWTSPSRALPLPGGRQPQISGVHPALVIGRKGLTASNRGTVECQDNKVWIRFRWQRTVPAVAASNNSADPYDSNFRAPLVRVNEGWAGLNYGSRFFPRIGDEVLASFIDGDPARPVIIGRVYNQAALPPFDPGSYINGIKTQSEPRDKNTDPERFHLLRFDDTMGKEQLLLRSQGRLDVTSLNSTYVTTQGDFNLTVQRSDDKYAKPKGGNALISASGSFNLNSGGATMIDVGADMYLTTRKSFNLDIEGSMAQMVKGTLVLNADTVSIVAKTALNLAVGGNFVTINASGINMNGTLVNINTGGTAPVIGPVNMQDAVTPQPADPGTPPDWRDKQIEKLAQKKTLGAGGGGGRIVTPVVAKVDTQPGPNGSIIVGPTLKQKTPNGERII